jgi:integrase
MRRGEILGLKWNQIKNDFIYLDKTKTKNRREIPINDDLAQALKAIRQEKGLRSKYVFTYKGLTIQRVDRAFKAALKRAGIEDFKFHDLRHTFASHLAMKGASSKDLQELLGHKTMSMTTRYAHLSQEHKKKAVNLLNGLTAPKQPTNEKCHISIIIKVWPAFATGFRLRQDSDATSLRS